MSIPEVKGFKVIPLKFRPTSSAQHYLFMKEHVVREKCVEKPADRTLFIIGVPPYCTEKSLELAFSNCGKVNKVYLQSKPSASAPTVDASKYFPKHSIIKGWKVAYVVFAQLAGLEAALRLDPASPLLLSSDSTHLATGIKKWVQDYNARVVDVADLQADVDSYMREYDEREAARLQKDDAAEDDDGWVTVTKRGRTPGFARKESVEKKIMGKERKKRSKKQLLNFYRFQIKESKMNHLMDLRQKFEEDKKKVALLKQTRKFKPF